MIPGNLYGCTGPMFGGKSSWVITFARKALIAKFRVLVVKPNIDSRYSKEQVATHDGMLLEARVYGVRSIHKLLEVVDDYDVFIIDEAQFFSSSIVEVVEMLLEKGKTVAFAGLARDFAGRPFGSMPQLLAIADEVVYLEAVCAKCGSFHATWTQRLVNGRPAHINDPIVVVGASEQYEARCRKCHKVLRG